MREAVVIYVKAQPGYSTDSTYLLIYLLTYLFHGAGYYLKSWLSLSLSKYILLSYGNRRFIIMLIKTRHWTLSWASWMQFAPSIPISLRSSLMLSSHLCLGLVFQWVTKFSLWYSLTVRHWNLSWASGVHFTASNSVSLRSISTHDNLLPVLEQNTSRMWVTCVNCSLAH
jgi:hypothetical protein